MRILAVSYSKGSNLLSAARFSAGGTLEIMNAISLYCEGGSSTEDPSCSNQLADYLISLRLEFQPSLILASSRADQTLLDAVNQSLPLLMDENEVGFEGGASQPAYNPAQQDGEQHGNGQQRQNLLQLGLEGDEEEDAPLNEDECQVEIRPSSEFKYPNGKKLILSLALSDEFTSVEFDLVNNPQGLETMLQMDKNKESIGCAGALLAHLSTLGALDLVKKVQLFSLSDTMYISLDSLYALHIFDEVPQKHSTSLFSLIDRTKTYIGRKKLRSWFLAPLQDIKKINSRQDIISLFMDPENVSFAEQIYDLLDRIPNVKQLTSRLRVKCLVSDWKKLLEFLKSAFQIMAVISTSAPNLNLFILENFRNPALCELFQGMMKLIIQKFDFEESNAQGGSHLVIREHVDPDLDSMKRGYAGLDSLLGQVAETINLPQMAEGLPLEFSVVYFPQLGYLLKVVISSSMVEEGGEIVLEGLDYQFSADDFAYFKNDDMRGLDTQLGDIHSMIIDRELEIMQMVRDEILSYRDEIFKIYGCIGELDCFLSIARASTDYRYTRPIMKSEDCLILEKMRHPLLERFSDVQAFVENDLKMGGLGLPNIQDSPKAIIITAPNASGKSVILQQVALIVYMAHVGLFVPARFAAVGIVDKILVRMRTVSSVSIRESAFLSDLKQACGLLTQSTNKSLVVMDEFGKGTTPSDGIGLFAAILLELIHNVKCKVLAASHFHEMFSFNVEGLGSSINEGLLEIMTLATIEEGENGVEFLYELIHGRSNTSLGIQCALNAGCSLEVVARAQEISDAMGRGDPIPNLILNRAEMEKKEEAALALTKRFLQLDFSRDALDLDRELWRHVLTYQSLT